MNTLKYFSRLVRYDQVIFLIFLIGYICLTVYSSSEELVGDESRYLTISKNYIDLNLSTDFQVNIWNGPLYPIYLIPFIVLNIPLIYIKLSNAVLLYFSLLIVYKTLKSETDKEKAFVGTIIVGCYFPFYTYLSLILTESLSWFLIACVIFSVHQYFKKDTFFNNQLILAVLFAFLLCMTKVLFGYVVVISLAVAIISRLFKNNRIIASKSILVLSITIILSIPWLIYTYSISNKVFYWSSAGGKSLYSMSSPFEGELGDWKSTEELCLDKDHKEFINQIINLQPIERDSAYMKRSIINIKNYPFAYAKNWTANVGRLFLSHPFSSSKLNGSTILKIVFHSIIILIILSCIYYLLRLAPQNRITISLKALLIFFCIYLFLSSLLSAYIRFFMITIPFWAILFSLTITRLKTIKNSELN